MYKRWRWILGAGATALALILIAFLGGAACNKVVPNPMVEEVGSFQTMEAEGFKVLISGQFQEASYRLFDDELGRRHYLTLGEDQNYTISIFDDNRDGTIDHPVEDGVMVTDKSGSIRVHIFPPWYEGHEFTGIMWVGDAIKMNLTSESARQMAKEAELIIGQLPRP